MDAKLPGRLELCPRPEVILDMIKDECNSRGQMMNFSSFSPSLYDTAWLAMIPTETDPHARLFPQCLEILLQAQDLDGTWPSYRSSTDGILVSLAALLSIATIREKRLVTADEYSTCTQCIEKGVNGVQKLLQSWDVEKAVHVGFELLTTSLVRQLKDFSIDMVFPGQAKLRQLYEEKMSKFSFKTLYGSKQTTLLHSIEAFVGVIDFARVSHHCSDDSGIFGSPAATAAYLIHSPEWNHRAERYLRNTITAYGNTGHAPSAFPTPLFELSWAISSMLSPIVEDSVPNNVDMSPVITIFQEAMEKQGSLVGFSPGILEDADDTARSLLMLTRLRRLDYETTVDLAPLVNKFEAPTCFKTYDLERNPSFSANCNVVLALLETEDRPGTQYASQIEKALTSLLNIVETGDRNIKDKWNISSEYSAMLLFEVMVVALRQYDAGCLQTLPQEIFTNRVPKTVCRLISQILTGQQNDGSWEQSLEVTSYSILGLSHASRLPWDASIRAYITDRIEKAKSFVEAEYPRVEEKDYLWIEKTTFQSSLLRMAYCSMALHTTRVAEKWSKCMTETFTNTSSQAIGMKKLFGRLSLLEKVPGPLLDLMLVEAKHHTSDLASGMHSILPSNILSAKKDKYLQYIPVIWLLSNQINNQSLSTGVIGEMLRLSQLTYQIDEYMETAIAALSNEQTSTLETWIKCECDATKVRTQPNGNGHCKAIRNRGLHNMKNGHSNSLEQAKTTLGKFIQYTLRHKAVRSSSPVIQRFLATELAEYLLGHMRQNCDNAALESHCSQSTLSSYFSWARSTGADHTSCPLAFRFFMCLISESEPSFETAQAQYYSSAVAHHLATMCRQYNDYGSIARDAEEYNLNSVNFPEFQTDTSKDQETGHLTTDYGRRNSETLLASDQLSAAKNNLMAIAEFERKIMETSFQALREVIPSRKAIENVRVLIDVTDLFGLLYVAKDVTSRKRSAAHMEEQAGTTSKRPSLEHSSAV